MHAGSKILAPFVLQQMDCVHPLILPAPLLMGAETGEPLCPSPAWLLPTHASLANATTSPVAVVSNGLASPPSCAGLLSLGRSKLRDPVPSG